MTDMTTTPEWAPADLRNHEKLQKAFHRLETEPKFQFDLSVIDEIEHLVSITKHYKESVDKMRVPSRYQTAEDLSKLTEFIARAQAHRDRAVEIKIGHLPQRRALKMLYEKCIGFLYRFEEIRKCSPAPSRDAAINYVLYPIRDMMSQVDMIIEAASEADRNLGNVYFSLKELKSIGMAYIEAQQKEKGH